MKNLLLIGIIFMASFFTLQANDAELTNQQEKKLILILLGPPGSGKGTQSKELSKVCQIPHISTGDLFRENIRRQTELGKKAKEYIDQGNLVPDQLVIDMVKDRIEEKDAKKGYLLDGFPRTVTQAEKFQSLVKNTDQVIVLYLKVSDQVIIDRIAGRLLCKNCPNIHHAIEKKPRKEGVCDECGGELYQRVDDRSETVKKRLKVYHEQTKPLVSYFKTKDLLYTINGEKPPEEVFEELVQFTPCRN